MKLQAWIFAAVIVSLSAGAAALRLRAQDPPADPTHYYVVDLGNPGGGTASVSNALNNLGWPMGGSNLPGDVYQHATAWVPGTPADLGTLGGPNSVVPFTIRNNAGEIVGIAETAKSQPNGEFWSCALAFFATVDGHTCLGFTWQNGQMTPLSTFGGDNGFAASVNDSGQVVGWAETTYHDPTCVAPQVLQFKAALWDADGQIHALPKFGADPDSAAVAINDEGQVVGISGTCDNAVGAYSAIHAVLWQNGQALDLGNIGGHGWNTPDAINNRGEVAGFADVPGDIVNGQLVPNFHAFSWTRERGMVDLGTLQGDAISEATGINNEGQIVGISFDANFTHPRAFIYQDGKMTPLNSLLVGSPNLSLVVTGDINDAGEITGQAVDMATGATPAFLAIPLQAGDEWSQEETHSNAPITVPESMRQTILRRHGLLKPGSSN